MFPLRDDVPSRRLPAVVWALVFVNAVIFLHDRVAGVPVMAGSGVATLVRSVRSVIHHRG